MTHQATVSLVGVGSVAVNTNKDYIVLVGAITTKGDYANCKVLKVSRNIAAAKAAEKVETVWLKSIDAEQQHFMVCEENN